MKLQIIPKTELITTKWSGGTTTQLAIYPEGSSYADRNFLFRISTATVEVEESFFTKLPGVSRKIMILDGVLRLEHKGRHNNTLHKFETDSFEGDWETKGFGRVTDFNLMTTGKIHGSLKGKSLKAGEFFEFRLVNPKQAVGFYPFKGKFIYETGNEIITLNEKDFLFAGFDRKNLPAKVTALLDTELIVSKVYLPGG